MPLAKLAVTCPASVALPETLVVLKLTGVN